MNILGINAYHGDVSAVLVSNGKLVAAVEEERIRRIKHCAGFPSEAIRSCLEIAGMAPGDIDRFAVSRDPGANTLRRFVFAMRRRPSLALVRDRFRNRSRVSNVAEELAETLGLTADTVRSRLHWVEHHPAHLASAFFVSPFDEAAVCAIDGFGDFVSTSMAVGSGSALSLGHRTYFPHSLGLLYLALTQFLGFESYGDEYKVMGLAPYGEPAFGDEMRELLSLESGGGLALALPYFRHWSDGVAMTWEDAAPTVERVYTEELEKLLGPRRRPDEPITSRHEAIAASLQAVFEEGFFHVLEALQRRTGLRRLCLAGGCAMNSVANGKIRKRTGFEEVYIQPAAGDNGTALGAAFYVWHQLLGNERGFTMEHAYWGPSFDDTYISGVVGAHRSRVLRDPRELVAWAAERLASGKVVGWFQGRMEWGARALGNRSILADPRRADMRSILNEKIKLREEFRPFAPSILEERLHDYFDDAIADPFMVQVFPVAEKKRDVIPAVTHVDGSGRVQTVSAKSNPSYHRLLRAFETRTGVPVLLNTSFNENEPIVNDPSEALDCFLRTDMDVLVLGDHILEKDRRPEEEAVAATTGAST